ncbi:MAG: hypothetical protein PHV11_04545, partial [Candidatus Bipolaricaulis sp.]|nr:hypothetical protein [Candidatus Bipolaricaulis sp.]
EKLFSIQNRYIDIDEIPYSKAKITIDIYFKTNRRRDVANYLGGGLIAWLDTFVDVGIIADDNYECIGQPGVNFYVDKDNPRTEITIKEENKDVRH